MKVSLSGLISHCIEALPKRASATVDELRDLERHLGEMKTAQASGEAAIDAFLAWYLRVNPAVSALRSLPRRASMEQFGLLELSRHITELAFRKGEGSAVIAEFFELYV